MPPLRTSLLKRFGRNMGRPVKGKPSLVPVGRENEVFQLQQILLRQYRHHPMLAGGSGVGKTCLVEALAAVFATGTIPEGLKGWKLLRLEWEAVTAEAQGKRVPGEVWDRIFDEAAATRTVLFFDDFHLLLKHLTVTAGELFRLKLARPDVRVITALSRENYLSDMAGDDAWMRLFQPLLVEPPGPEAAKEMISLSRHQLEKHHGIEISDAAVEAAINLGPRYEARRQLPGSALLLLDDAAAKLHLTKLNGTDRGRERRRKTVMTLDASDVADVMAVRMSTSVGQLLEKSEQVINQLPTRMAEEVLGQEVAMGRIVQGLRRGLARPSDTHKLLATFLFTGPDGVGKTLAARALARHFYRHSEAFLRLNLSHYTTRACVGRLVGMAAREDEREYEGHLCEPVRQQPHSVIVMDHLLQAHKDIVHLVVRLMEEGGLRDGQGRWVDFRKCLLILESNVGASLINNSSYVPSQLEKMVVSDIKDLFPADVIKRLDDIVVFDRLSESAVHELVDREILQLTGRLAARGCHLELDSSVRETLRTSTEGRFLTVPSLHRNFQQRLVDPLMAHLAGVLVTGITGIRIIVTDPGSLHLPLIIESQMGATS